MTRLGLSFFLHFLRSSSRELELLFLIIICETDSDGVHRGKAWCGPSTFGIGQALSIIHVVALLGLFIEDIDRNFDSMNGFTCTRLFQ